MPTPKRGSMLLRLVGGPLDVCTDRLGKRLVGAPSVFRDRVSCVVARRGGGRDLSLRCRCSCRGPRHPADGDDRRRGVLRGVCGDSRLRVARGRQSSVAAGQGGGHRGIELRRLLARDDGDVPLFVRRPRSGRPSCGRISSWLGGRMSILHGVLRPGGLGGRSRGSSPWGWFGSARRAFGSPSENGGSGSCCGSCAS